MGSPGQDPKRNRDFTHRVLSLYLFFCRCCCGISTQTRTAGSLCRTRTTWGRRCTGRWKRFISRGHCPNRGIASADRADGRRHHSMGHSSPSKTSHWFFGRIYTKRWKSTSWKNGGKPVLLPTPPERTAKWPSTNAGANTASLFIKHYFISSIQISWV